MQKDMMRLMRISSIMYNCTFRANYECTLSDIKTRQLSHFADKDNFKPVESTEIINSTKKSANLTAECEDIRKLTQQFYNANITDGISALTYLNSNHKQFRVEDVLLITKSKEFEELCAKIQKDIKLFSIDQILTCLKIMKTLKLPKNSRIVAELLQHIKVSINDLSINHIMYLCELLNNYDETKVGKAIRHVLPIIFRNQIAKLDINRVAYLKMSLRMPPDFLDRDTFNVIVNQLLLHAKHLQLEDALDIFRSLSFLNSYFANTDVKQLFAHLNSVFQSSAHRMTIYNAKSVLKSMYTSVESGKQFAYDPHTVCTIIQSMMQTVSPLIAVQILQFLNKLKHDSKEFMSYLTERDKDGHTFSYYTLLDKCNVICGLSLADFKPNNWPAIKDILLQFNLTGLPPRILLHLATSLSVLDYYNSDILKTVFSSNIMHPKDTFYLLCLHQNVKTFYPTYTGPFMSDKIVKTVSKMQEHVESDTLTSTLQYLLRGVGLVRSNVRTKLGHFIHNVVLLPQSSNCLKTSDIIMKEEDDGVLYVEDIKLPHNCRGLLVFLFSPMMYDHKSENLLPIHTKMVKTAEAYTGFRALALNVDVWEKYRDSEKLLYVRENIL